MLGETDLSVGQIAIHVKDYRAGVFDRIRHFRTPEVLDVEMPLQNTSGEARWIVSTPGRLAFEDGYLLIDFSEPESDEIDEHHFMVPTFQRVEPQGETLLRLSIPRTLRTEVGVSKHGLQYHEIDLLKEKMDGVLVRLAISDEPLSPDLKPNNVLAALRKWRTDEVRAPVAVQIEETLGL